MTDSLLPVIEGFYQIKRSDKTLIWQYGPTYAQWSEAITPADAMGWDPFANETVKYMIDWDVTVTFKSPNLHLERPWNSAEPSMISASRPAEATDFPPIQISKQTLKRWTKMKY